MQMKPEEQLRELRRGAVDIVSEDELLKKLKHSYETQKPLRIKAGFDPSRPDLHLGHAVLINKLKQFQDLGHHVIFLIGDFTGLIGDPTGRNETRPALTVADIEENAKTYAKQVFKILDPDKTEIAYNSHWMNKFSAQDFIKLTGQYTVARMLERDDFHKRFREQVPISVHEFLYPLVQGYDSVALRADVELGGTDQRFNLLVGRDIQRSYGVAPQCILTTPILEGLDGVQKMSKSLDNYIGLVESPREMFGKTMRISDELMVKYYELLTDLTVDQLTTLKQNLASGQKHPRQAKVELAKFVVGRFHSPQAAEQAEIEFNRMFVDKGLPDEMPEIQQAPADNVWICHLLVQMHLASGTSEARRLIQGKAVELAGERVLDPNLRLNLRAGDEMVIRSGKKKFAKLVVTP
jgi:tyrosyl-tRNA synthetase